MDRSSASAARVVKYLSLLNGAPAARRSARLSPPTAVTTYQPARTRASHVSGSNTAGMIETPAPRASGLRTRHFVSARLDRPLLRQPVGSEHEAHRREAILNRRQGRLAAAQPSQAVEDPVA